jgi:hypothetical protein
METSSSEQAEKGFDPGQISVQEAFEAAEKSVEKGFEPGERFVKEALEAAENVVFFLGGVDGRWRSRRR